MRAALSLVLLGGLVGLAACAEQPVVNVTANETNTAAQEGVDLNSAVSGEELSPVPEAVDDMVANGSEDAVGNEALPRPSIPGETR